MKRTIVITSLIMICFGIKAIAAAPDDCYLKTGDNFYSGKDIKMGLIHTKIFYSDGTYTEVDNRDITAYRHHNKVYMMMPVICDKNDTLCLAMMEYITAKKGFSVFRYCCTNSDDAFSRYVSKRDVFFIYKDGKFYKRIEEEQTEALKSFGIKVI
jgi:hypothetical protein